MKTLLTAAALAIAIAIAIAFAAPAAEARTVKHQPGSHVSSGVQAKAGAKKVTKTKKKHAKKGHKKTA